MTPECKKVPLSVRYTSLLNTFVKKPHIKVQENQTSYLVNVGRLPFLSLFLPFLPSILQNLPDPIEHLESFDSFFVRSPPWSSPHRDSSQ